MAVKAKKTSKSSEATKAKENKPKRKLFSFSWLTKWRKKKSFVNVVHLHGAIGQGSAFKSGLTIESMADLLDQAFECKKAKAVALVINCPGGSPVQSSFIGKRIRDLAVEHKKPVFAFVEDVAASGGYWLACSADEIYADASSIIGSIGVISYGFGFPELLKKHGVERRVYTSGKSKSTLDPFKPEKKEDIAKLKQLQEIVHQNFIAWIKSRRADALKKSDDFLFNGDFWVAEMAQSYGLIDGIGDIKSVMQEKYGKKVQFNVIRTEGPWWRKKAQLGVHENMEGIVNSMTDAVIARVENYIEQSPMRFK